MQDVFTTNSRRMGGVSAASCCVWKEISALSTEEVKEPPRYLSVSVKISSWNVIGVKIATRKFLN